jgi:hypothetical protein
MASPALATYLAEARPDEATARLLGELDAAITAAHPGFDSAVKYKILMYTLDRAWRQWVVAISSSGDGASLRFLYGVLMDDPRGVLRPGSSTLCTWDFRRDDVVDADAVGVYVRDAVARLPEYRADGDRITAQARTTAKDRERAFRSRSAGSA